MNFVFDFHILIPPSLPPVVTLNPIVMLLCRVWALEINRLEQLGKVIFERYYNSVLMLIVPLQDDESLRRWKEKLLGCLESDLSGNSPIWWLVSLLHLYFELTFCLFVVLEQREPEVKFHSIGIISDEFGEINTPLPVNENRSGRVLFTLREGSRYQLRLTFTVMHNIVSGLSYSNKVWRGGLIGT